MNAYLPHTIRLPFGFTIRIKAVAPSTLKRLASGDAYGMWDGEARTIYVDKSASEHKQRYVLTHELMHAVVEWQHIVLGEDKE